MLCALHRVTKVAKLWILQQVTEGSVAVPPESRSETGKNHDKREKHLQEIFYLFAQIVMLKFGLVFKPPMVPFKQ